jgi:hypothetical protein
MGEIKLGRKKTRHFFNGRTGRMWWNVEQKFEDDGKIRVWMFQ